MFEDLSLTQNPVVDHQYDHWGIYTTVIWQLSLNSKHLDSAILLPELSRNDIWADFRGGRNIYNCGSSVLDDLCSAIHRKRSELLEYAVNINPRVFRYNWMVDLDHYMQHSELSVMIHRDQPGFVMTPHKDNNSVMIQYVINLANNPSSTQFYNKDLSDTVYCSSTTEFEGVGFLNTPVSAHSIDDIDRTRYILYVKFTDPGPEQCDPDQDYTTSH